MPVTQRWERRFAAMGTQCHIVVVGGGRFVAARAEDRVAELAALWTRFEPDSEISRLNTAGRARLSEDSWRLVTAGIVGRQFTAGRFDPFMARQIVAAGYDRDFADLTVQEAERTTPASPRPVLELSRRHRFVRLAPGAAVDSGGIGKGLAADLVSAQIMAAGVDACLVNLGGDLRVRGDKGSPWQVGIDREVPGPELTVRLLGGGLATSSTTKRTWRTSRGGEHHHLIDPRTGWPMRVRWAGATAIAPSAWVAEALSKALLLFGSAPASRLVRRHRGGGLLQDRSGGVVTM